jgi:hypothetical protein
VVTDMVTTAMVDTIPTTHTDLEGN